MAGKVLRVELFNRIGALSPTRLAVIKTFTVLKDERRIDGNDKLSISWPLNDPATALVSAGTRMTTGSVIKIIREVNPATGKLDITEDFVYLISRQIGPAKAICNVSCMGIRSALGKIFPNQSVTLVGQTPAQIISAVDSLPGFPTWLGLVGWPSSPPNYALTINPADATGPGDSIGAAFTNSLSALDNLQPDGSLPLFAIFVPTISGETITGYTAYLYGPGSPFSAYPVGTSTLLEGTNVSTLEERDDLTDPTFPVKTYIVGANDQYRENIAKYPLQNFVPGQMTRLCYPSRSIDTAQLLAAVNTNYLDTTGTVLELSAPVRRTPYAIQQAVAATTALGTAVAAIPPAAVVGFLTPMSVTATQVVLRVTAYVPNGPATGTQVFVTYAFEPVGLGISPGPGGSFYAYSTIGGSGYIDFTIIRNAFGGAATNLNFLLLAAGYQYSTLPTAIETVSDLASATKTVRFGAGAFVPNQANTAGGVLVLNGDGAVEMAVVGTGSFSAPLPLPEGVTITGLTGILWGSGGSMVAIIYDQNNNPVGSAISAGSSSYSTYTQALSEYVTVGASAKTYRLVVFFTTTGGSVHDARMMSLTVSYTSAGLQNTY